MRRTSAAPRHPPNFPTQRTDVNKALLARLAALEAKLERHDSLADSSLESIGSVDLGDESRRSSSGSLNGRKRERTLEEEEAERAKDEEMRLMKERVEMLEQKLADLYVDRRGS